MVAVDDNPLIGHRSDFDDPLLNLTHWNEGGRFDLGRIVFVLLSTVQ